jgi:FkbM family methyltransferase
MPSDRPNRSSEAQRQAVEAVAKQVRDLGRQLASRSRRLLTRTLETGLERLASGRQTRGAERPVGASPATFSDVLACYRLLLERSPDTGGLAHQRQRLASGTVTLHELVEEFLGSVEFARARSAHEKGLEGHRPVSQLVETGEGFRIHVDPTDYAVGHTIALDASYEPEVSATLRQVLGAGGTFVDAGANIGWFTLLGASLVGPTGRVVAIEPNPLNVALLRQSARDNGFDNVDVMAVALSDEGGVVALETDGSNGRVIPIEGPPTEPVAASFVVAAQTLDTILDSFGVTRVDVVKVDIEGAEPLALRGAAKMIARDRPILISEFYPLALDSSPWGSAQGYLAMLRELGYRLSVIGQHGDHEDANILALARRPGADHVDLLARPL